MQHDFIDGALANPAAEAIVPGIVREIRVGNYERIIFTRDTHYDDTYMNTPEGRHLPVKHCLFYTPGWHVHEDLQAAAKETGANVFYMNKHTFGAPELWAILTAEDEINMVGTCTDICVLNNALLLKTLGGEINVIERLCAGLSPELHRAAIEMMRHNHINIIEPTIATIE